ncbi:Gag-pol fusion protein [Phytophthora palmivora]|uniref:Gag-pol fusion protein n=1 Tax=Phytophthora palmivora TaxID=4796 RepID=A0A2P4X434_9STRA|nr:Gag-pol fusion protein [Phytophthora palmivora]
MLKAHSLVAFIEGDLGFEVEQAAIDAINTGRNFEEFFADVGQLSVLVDFSGDLDNELWTMKKRRDDSVVKFSQRPKENVRMFAEFPLNDEEVHEVQQRRYLKRGMPRVWQDKLTAAGIVHDREKEGKQNQGRTKDQHGDTSASKSQRKDGKNNSDGSERKHKSDKWCSFRKTSSHNTSDCYTVKEKEKDEQRSAEMKTASATNVNLGRKVLSASSTVFGTMNGSVTSSCTTMVQFIFPTLNTGSVTTDSFDVIDDSHDAIVIGRDIMNALGLILNFKGKITDEDYEDEYADETKEIADEQLLLDLLDNKLAQHYLGLLIEHGKLYDGHLDRMRFEDYLIPLSPDYKPVHAKPYAISRSQETKAKEAIQRLINADVLEDTYDSKMASPAFFLVKKDSSLRLLIDYRWVNKYLRQSPYYVPRIREIQTRLAKAKCLSTFDTNLGYYTRRLARKSHPPTAFCLPLGKFQYKRLPMGISTGPDEYQAFMEKIFGDLEFVVVYLDDILVLLKDEEERLEHLRIVFERLAHFDKPFHLYADVSGTQLDGLIMQETKIRADAFSRMRFATNQNKPLYERYVRMEPTIARFVKKCIIFKRAKLHGGKQDYGLLSPRTMKTVNPFDVVHVDLVGPYEGQGYGITMIDQASRRLEVGVLPNKDSLTTAESFDRNQAIRVKNPQVNAICERVLLEIGNVLGCNEGADWRNVIYYAAFANMISHQLHDANWSYLSKHRFNAILADNDHENDKRLEHFYKPGDQ